MAIEVVELEKKPTEYIYRADYSADIILTRKKLQYYKKNPENTKDVTRKSRWGNKYRIIEHGGIYTIEESLLLYKQRLDLTLRRNPDFLKPLVGFNLGCYCKLHNKCHADIIFKKLLEEYPEYYYQIRIMD